MADDNFESARARFRELLRRLTEQHVDFVIVGGVAASLLGAPISTLDVDVCVPMTEVNKQRILDALRGLHARHRMRPDRVIPLVDDVSQLKNYKNLNLETDLGVIDVLGELPNFGAFEDLNGKTIELNLGGFVCRVIDLDTLIKVKRAAGRNKDLFHLDHLEAIQKLRQKQPDLFEPPMP